MQDDGFHEIQLNGKQLVFLFMAATVVSVVIFLCGVLVGRGVKAERTAPASEAAATAAVTETAVPAAAPVPASADPTNATPPPAVDEGNLSYFNRLEKPNAPEELKAPAPPAAARPTPKPVAPAPRDEPAAAPQTAATTASTSTPATPATSAASTPASTPAAVGDGYAIQVAALREQGEAETIAKRLVAKGYGAYVLTPPDGRPNVFRVRIGTFKTRRDAEVVATKLQKEEQFKPWITR